MKHYGSWITAPQNPEAAAVEFRHSFTPRKPVKQAEICATAMGIYALYIDKKRIGKGVLTPGWTSYFHRVQVQAYDVTDYLSVGKESTVGIGLGQGWAVGFLGWKNANHYFAEQASTIAWLKITYTDGTEDILATDTTWDVYTTPVTFSEIYHGETVDLTAPIINLGKAVCSDVQTQLVPQEGEWITEQERLAPIEVIHTPKGELVLDFGQNMTGYVEVKIKGVRGSRIVMHHAEVLDENGNFYNANLRAARSENIYVLSGNDDVFKPTFSFQGFRYIRLTEFPFDTVDTECFRAVVVHSELKRTGYFSCGNEKINQLYHNVIWGQKSNYLDIPTDCPQRDERLGWTGDTQVFCRTAAINYDVEKFFKKWLADVALEQHSDGAVAGVVPMCIPSTLISAAWGDLACIAPWELYLAYGNKKELKKNFPMMKKWVEYIHSAGPEEYLWLSGLHYGDWLATDGDGRLGATSNDLIASAFFAYSTSLLIFAGEALGEDMSHYRELYTSIKKAFRSYFMENGMPKESLPATEIGKKDGKAMDVFRKGITQTALVLILHFHLYEGETERLALSNKLADLIRQNGTRLNTGFVGTPYLLHALSDNGFTELAYDLLLQEKMPSWLYSVNKGATTMWENWDSIREDGTLRTSSFNHYAYGAVFDWIFGVCCGIKPMGNAPAYQEIQLKPHPDRRLGFADTSIDTRNGKIRAHWYYKNNTVFYEFSIPRGVIAHLTLPSGYTSRLTEGEYIFGE